LAHSRTIRKLTFGVNPLREGLAFVIGQVAGGEHTGYKISTLQEDTQALMLYGKSKYNIYIIDRSLEEVLWKSFVGVPVSVEYFLPGEKEIITI
jgi:hypothetical protein